MTAKQVAKDSVIFREGDNADTAYYVVSGKVELSQSEGGQIAVLRTVGENDVFGELAVFDPVAARPYTAKAAEACELAPVAPEELSALLEKASQPLRAIITLATDKMKKGRQKTVSKKEKALSSGISKIVIRPDSAKMKAMFSAPVEVSVGRLPFRIGGFPEGGETNRRDMTHLSIPVQSNPLRISRQQCEISVEDDTLMLVDLGSRFCTTVNGTTIGRGRGTYSQPLAKGENKITLGNKEWDYSLLVTCE